MDSKYYWISPVASAIPFDNSTNGFNSDEVQSAIEEIATRFSPFNILTHFRNATGTRIQTYERTSGTHIDSPPLVVVDNDGNVVMKG